MDSGFAPISRSDALVLVLGSMPGQKSLKQTQYYGNPHNAFWRIMSEFTGVTAESDYTLRIAGLTTHQIAVWDVIKRCVRPGSLDSDIERSSIEANDFATYFSQHKQIKAVFFNGGRAALEYRRHVLPTLQATQRALPTTQLLSTSPANARYTLLQKQTDWRVINKWLTSCGD